MNTPEGGGVTRWGARPGWGSDFPLQPWLPIQSSLPGSRGRRGGGGGAAVLFDALQRQCLWLRQGPWGLALTLLAPSLTLRPGRAQPAAICRRWTTSPRKTSTPCMGSASARPGTPWQPRTWAPSPTSSWTARSAYRS